MTDLDVLARKLALRHVADDADRGISEDSIRLSRHGSSCPEHLGGEFGSYDVSIGGWTVGMRSVPPTKVLVRRIQGVDVNRVYSLHELFMECQSDQLSLL
jgi:hypothetical protein